MTTITRPADSPSALGVLLANGLGVEVGRRGALTVKSVVWPGRPVPAEALTFARNNTAILFRELAGEPGRQHRAACAKLDVLQLQPTVREAIYKDRIRAGREAKVRRITRKNRIIAAAVGMLLAHEERTARPDPAPLIERFAQTHGRVPS